MTESIRLKAEGSPSDAYMDIISKVMDKALEGYVFENQPITDEMCTRLAADVSGGVASSLSKMIKFKAVGNQIVPGNLFTALMGLGRVVPEVEVQGLTEYTDANGVTFKYMGDGTLVVQPTMAAEVINLTFSVDASGELKT